MKTFCKLTAQSPAASYVPLPRFLLQDEALRGISNDAKVLYALLLDRASISRQNGYVEPDGTIRLYFTLEQAQTKLHRSRKSATRIFRELEYSGLIVRRKQGLGKPALILDEPTNHLDIASREWMEDALSDYEQTLLFVSHDRYFIEKFATRVWALADGKITDFRGSYRDYCDWRERQAVFAQNDRQREREQEKALEKEKKSRPPRSKNNEKSIAKLEKEIAKLEAQSAELDRQAEEFPVVSSCNINQSGHSKGLL